jgi:hypothetical protein
MHQQNGSSLIFQLTAAACLVNGAITVIFFLLYIKARCPAGRTIFYCPCARE